jgi:hypothetical protein
MGGNAARRPAGTTGPLRIRTARLSIGRLLRQESRRGRATHAPGPPPQRRRRRVPRRPIDDRPTLTAARLDEPSRPASPRVAAYLGPSDHLRGTRAATCLAAARPPPPTSTTRAGSPC